MVSPKNFVTFPSLYYKLLSSMRSGWSRAGLSANSCVLVVEAGFVQYVAVLSLMEPCEELCGAQARVAYENCKPRCNPM